ncbi:hypothetical protein E1162_04355 [Rhodobacteraceae bacterium RKSG542]|uniref:uroporphyrinogen decarboxylase family protein n=1 Tax=Pseudovibrio flavus TaxID=2529854 RepID=UPI0012BB84C7|nr:uroporphyrinogen decarboxylase family protein [Pseudovibrio flavus]MTI16470.1 hypothetical protein [Pseudovibrio flavus]
MNKMERFHAAVKGEAVDRVPMTFWLHFVTDALDGAESARLHARLIREYDLDLAKVISDYRPKLAEGLETLETKEDMLKIKVKDLSEREYQEQFRLLRVMRADFGDDVPVIDTSFDPIQQVLRLAGGEKRNIIFDNPKEAHLMLENVTETLCRYMRHIKSIGVDGVLYSTHAAITEASPAGVSDDIVKEFYHPYEKAVMDAMEGMVRIVHPCLTHLDMDRILGYDFEVLSWWDRGTECPSLAEMRAKTDRCLMGGFDHAGVINRPLPKLQDEIFDALDQVDGRGIILSPGCTIYSQVPSRTLRTVRDAVDQWSAANISGLRLAAQ